ncbi:GDSL-type esterase/lipase family protein [Lacrimispora celerecrescens]|uniref:Lysophospholipase L1-like esterase n=1 Tax=[Clostridium] celerecrescens 18A TaxID=1286362 RepID=A0A2M8Z524_9FIRM|nr:GDSL-type esterase/lipase family protein [Lacrimispora celerecrescens]PJJ28529.1 lysophospholipase L1-like esterase [[Clostridium] celerecrescens 18A]
MRKYWFTLLLAVSLVLIAVLHASAGSMDQLTSLRLNLAGSKWTHGNSIKTTDRADESDNLDVTERSDETADERSIDGASEANDADVTDSTSGSNDRNAEFTPSAMLLQSGQRPEPPENFRGVLFVGDSRTMGLSEYGDLGNASVFANSGMSVFNVFTARVSSGGEKLTLDEVLSSEHYQMIYLMLGINELGYDMSQTIKQYKEVLDKIKEMQPEAVMVLEANLHITSEKSEKSPVYSNSKINRLNQEIQKIAEENSCYYIDVNEIFDDKGGSLNQAYSTDGSHVLGKYYAEWVKWLKEEKV